MLDPEPSFALVRGFITGAARAPLPAAHAQSKPTRWRALCASATALRGRLGTRFSLLSWCLAAQLPKDAVILDLACADGRWLSLLAARGHRRLHSHLLAALPEHVTWLRHRGVVATEGSFLSQEFPSASYDCIRVHDALGMLPEPAAAVRQCLRMLKPSGVLLLHAPNAGWSCLARAQVAESDEAPCHVYHHTSQALRALLTAAGFRDLQLLTPSNRQGAVASFNAMRQQVGKAALPALLGLLLQPAYLLTSLWGDQRGWITLVAREPTALRLRPSTNGHAHSARQARF
jgi:SAM-dependent methyltransferase